VVNAKFFFSELVTDCIYSSGNHRSLDVSIDGGKWLAAKVLGEKPAQSAVKNNQRIATADIPVPSDFSIPSLRRFWKRFMNTFCPEALISSSDFGSFSGYLKSLGHVPQQQCSPATVLSINHVCNLG
jgi:hypothetical protein